MKKVMALLWFGLTLVGCGQQGALYFPDGAQTEQEQVAQEQINQQPLVE